LSELTNGSFDLDVSSVKVAGLLPNLPVRTNDKQTLVSGKIKASDIDGAILTNPYAGKLIVEDLETNDTFSLNAELAKTDNIVSATEDVETQMKGLLKAPEIATDRVSASDQATWIEFDNNEINLSANAVKINGQVVVPSPDLTALETKTQNISLTSSAGGNY